MSSSSQPLIPIFKGENYHFWILKMKMMFKSQEPWDLVEEGFEDANPTELDQRLRETERRMQGPYFSFNKPLMMTFFLELQQQALPIKHRRF